MITRLLLLAMLTRTAGAQQADVIRGQISSSDGTRIEGATVQVTSIPNNVLRTARSDKDGRYAVTFAGGDGDYWVNVTALGFISRRFEIKRLADEQVLIGDVKLARAGAVLDAVNVRAERNRPARNDNASDVSGTDKTVGATAIDPTQAGSIAAIAASMPGVQLIPGEDGAPDAFSVFGLSGDQNRSTLNGLNFSGADVPRDAATRSSLGTSPWDVSRGGFSGGQFALRTQAGSNFSSRAMSSLLNAPPLQWTDQAGKSAGAEYQTVSLGAATTGPFALNRNFYSVGYQFDRRESALQNLLASNDIALRAAGVARDSAARLTTLLQQAGIPLVVGGLPRAKVNERGSVLAAFDFAPPSWTSGQALNITLNGTFARATSTLGRATALPTDDVGGTNWFASAQARHTSYFGAGVLTETSASVSETRNATDPYSALPSGGVRVLSALDDGSAALTRLTFGGSATQQQRTSTTALTAQNQLSWFSADNQHRLKFTSELRLERFVQRFNSNQFGTFSYNSLADLERGVPASFSRNLLPRVTPGSEVVAAFSLGDSYRRSSDLQFQYGVRVDGNRFLTTPESNPALATAFGVQNDRLPSRLAVSPRVGFSWTYGRASQLEIADGFARSPRAVLRGGLGIFQNSPAVQIIGSALTNTGLLAAGRQVNCVGSAVPQPDWNAYQLNAASIPDRCADGSTGSAFASALAPVTLFSDAWKAPRSLRANMNWSGAMLGGRVAALIDATWSRNRNQGGVLDLNFNAISRFALTEEGGRPVFVRPENIVPATGATAALDARVNPAFRSVVEQRSNLWSNNGQLTLAFAPATVSSRVSWNLSYVYSRTNDVATGFVTTVGDPRVIERGRSAVDSRHQLVYGFSWNAFNWMPISWSGSLRSGRPYTPMVAGDVNGDGFNNDRAFLFDPSAPSTNSALGAQMRALLASGSSLARRCVARQLGTLARRNSCDGPWASTSNLTVALNPVKFRLPQRVNVAFYVNNALGAADLLLHGEGTRRGWGQAVTPDASLLYVRGFDPVAQRFSYDVNPRFGSTRLDQTINRNPVVVTAQLRFDIGYTRERQLLTQSLDRGRLRAGTKSNEQDLKGMGNALIPTNPMSRILALADSLALTRLQADSISTINRRYSAAFDSIWTPVAQYLAALPDQYDRGAAYERYRQARTRSVTALIAVVPAVRELLTPAQLRRLPPFVTTSLDVVYLASVRSSSSGGANLGALGMLAQMGWAGGMVDASGGQQSISIHR